LLEISFHVSCSFPRSLLQTVAHHDHSEFQTCLVLMSVLLSPEVDLVKVWRKDMQGTYVPTLMSEDIFLAEYLTPKGRETLRTPFLLPVILLDDGRFLTSSKARQPQWTTTSPTRSTFAETTFQELAFWKNLLQRPLYCRSGSAVLCGKLDHRTKEPSLLPAPW